MKKILITNDFTYSLDAASDRTLPQGLTFIENDDVADAAVDAGCAVLIGAITEPDAVVDPLAETQAQAEADALAMDLEASAAAEAAVKAEATAADAKAKADAADATAAKGKVAKGEQAPAA